MPWRLVKMLKLTAIAGSLLLALTLAVPVAAQTSPWMVNNIYYDPVGAAGFQSITGMAPDPVSHEIYVLDAARHSIDVIDSAGFPRFSFTHWITDAQTKQRIAGEPNAIAITPAGEIFITDFFSRTIDVLNIRGEVLEQIDILVCAGWQDISLRPEKLGVDSAGWLYASVAGDRAGVIRRLASGGPCEVFIDAASEKIECITGMSVAPDGRVAVLDYKGTPAVRIYNPTGQLSVSFGGHEVAGADLSYPASLLFAEDGTFWVADALRQAVKHYAADGKYLGYIGGYGQAPGNLRYPSALSGNGVDNIFVAERVGRRVQEYVLPGVLAKADRAGSQPVAADPETEK